MSAYAGDDLLYKKPKSENIVVSKYFSAEWRACLLSRQYNIKGMHEK